MKRILLIAAFVILNLFLAGAQTKIDTITNDKVIKLSKLGLPPSIIVNKIQTSYTVFDVSTNALIQLSENRVSADVINAMMQADAKTQADFANQKDMNDPKTMRRTGIYFYNPNEKFKQIKRVDPTVISTAKSGGFGTFIAQAYTYGIAKSKEKSDLAGKNARLQLDDPNTVFYFYFENNANPKADDWFFATATSPNEFVIVKLKEKSDTREMVIASSNYYSSSTGVSSKTKVDFAYEEIADGIFKVTFKKPLEKGEYCFQYASSTPTQYSNNKVWDFGVLNNTSR
jgi:hypothetical protein